MHLKPSPAFSNTGALIDKAVEQLNGFGFDTKVIRIADHDIKPGNSSDEGEGYADPIDTNWLELKDLAQKESPRK